MEKTVFLGNSDPHYIVAIFFEAPGNLASQSQAKIKILFFHIEITIKIKRGRILEILTQRHNRRKQVKECYMNQIDCDNER